MLPSMGPIMSSMPILDPAPEPMETDIPSEEVIKIWFVCKYVVLSCYVYSVLVIVFIVVFRVRYVQIMMCFKMW